MLRLFYILYTWLIFVPIFLILTILTALTTILGCLLGGEKIFAYYPGMIWSRLTCYLALCPVKIKGREHIDRKKSYVFVANHQGAFDIFLIYGFLGVPIKWVMKAGIGKIPLVGAACRAAGFIFVDNSTKKAAARSVVEARKSLRNGASIAVFPEGSRTYDGKMIRFKRGAYQMADEQQLPIVPITLNGPFHVLPIGTLNLHRHRMEMIIHEPISTEGIDTSLKGLQHLADETREIIASALWPEFRDEEPTE
ncbi:1-acyl-sn-glycerol-3-phosphate acyltransferase [Parabacteroides sp. PFB2-12]|uniref:lysophospholipid acyltransferase family protein n=1 Tax=unclassified Parabacteroides TaxID=2649774 RepID=UPI002473E1BA|nr:MULTISPECIES: lysophospholipid acyltransferase family protein [unclassified Parabacteroides]MDH6341274.1 1-acyl-sn-glycerol-3-phosphate acyltransferase [Parabacteroides sp. PM6-13]MDH6389066.1 1-acyl-sn-glycerol-3-phosphate acyltransferase [Parabacteroides sp. PFB2-12]